MISWLRENCWRFLCPISGRWGKYTTGVIYVVRYKVFIFGIKVIDVQTSNPE